MTAGKSATPSAELLEQLGSKDQATVLKALHKLEKAGNSNDLPGIIQAMGATADPKLLSEFAFFLSKVRAKEAPATIAGFLSDPAFAHIRPELVRVAWESCLDYTPHLMLFARMFMAGDYGLALEAFTVIENTCLERPVNKKLLTEITILIKNSLPDQPETKQRLTRELILVLEPFVTGG
jgi:hypothetical protein